MSTAWTRRADRTHFHLRLIAWAIRRSERRDVAVTQVFQKLAA